MFVTVQLLKLFQNDDLLFLRFIFTLFFDSDGLLRAGELTLNLLALNTLLHCYQLLLDLALVLHEVWKESLCGNTTKLIGDVDLNYVLTENLVVKIPPAKVDQGKEAIKEFKAKSFDDKTVVV